MSGSLRGWKVPPIYEDGHPAWCRVVEAHSREDCKQLTKPFLANDEDKRWSNTYLHVALIEDPERKLRSLRTFLAGELALQRHTLQAARINANEAIDAGEHAGSISRWNDKIKVTKAVIVELRRVAKELRS